ncbi:MAG: acyl-CoA reductase [Chitinophagales bacterium]
MHLQERIRLLVELGKYMESNQEEWMNAKTKAYEDNSWFEPEFIHLAIQNIAAEFLHENKLKSWTKQYGLSDQNTNPKNIGLVMAGNIPLVGFHDFLCIFISGHRQVIKCSSKDQSLITSLVKKIYSLNEEARSLIKFSDMLKGCDAYIATGSNNTARYFEYYFGKYPSIIRRNRTSVAILNGKEGPKELELLANDICQYFGLGCRNITKILVPKGYDFVPLFEAFSKYAWMADHHKYKNNYDYQLTLLILNKEYYMTNKVIILAERKSPFSAISVLHYEFYTSSAGLLSVKPGVGEIQTVAGAGFTPFGDSQRPGLNDYADGIDTLKFLKELHS